MQKRLVKYLDGCALVIDEPMLEQVNATPDTVFEVITEGGAIFMTPVLDPDEDMIFENALTMVQRKFGRALRKMA